MMWGLWMVALGAANTAAVPAVSELPEPSKIVGAPEGAPLSGSELEARTETVGSRLRCPVCQGSSVAASPSEMARNMKAQVKDLLAQGYSEEQIFGYFEASYGEFVRLEPKKEGIKWGVWLLPLGAALLGILGLLAVLRRSTGQPTVSADELAAELEDYQNELERVRALVRAEGASHAS